ncbi:MAG TPA: hypothetical protein VJT78_00215 [Candidatus Dormibacteraeota bacterium]|nr:hypothetical protein [Candidatus Dormibacteraeota bacterium]
MKRLVRLVAVVALAIGTQVGASPGAHASEGASSTTECQLGNGISHVVNVVFDNVHLTRDNPNVPSDLEQMPHLLNFIEQNGTMISHNYTPLISHTANDIVTTLTGLYPDQQGLAVSNSYAFYNPNGTEGGFPSAFQYWTDKIGDGAYNNVTASGKNTPAPWVAFTRAGCNVGGVSTANIELENNGNITNVFGAGSPEAIEAQTNSSQATKDFIGIAIHCGKGSALCSAANNGKPDVLPQEPGGYNGFMGLFGHKYVAPVIAPSGLKDLSGSAINGFPGFGGITADQSLAYTAAMLEHAVPVTYSYISDAHDKHTFPFRAFGPGEAGYVQRLAQYDAAFAKFFTRLAADGITPQNTLFNFSSDENDHYAGRPGSPANCDGITVPCTYVLDKTTDPVGGAADNTKVTLGEITANLPQLMQEAGVTTNFDLHNDDAPAIYLLPRTGRTDPATRNFEQVSATLVDPRNNNTGLRTQLMQRMADPVEMKNLHMITGDPLRTPTFIYFGNADYFFNNFGGPDFQQSSGFAWQHGDFQPDIVTSFLGLVGPGVKHLGRDNSTWVSHADTRPTILALTHLRDDYKSEGRVIAEDLKASALPEAITDDQDSFVKLAQAYSQINAPVGEFGLDTLKISTKALASKSSGDETYTKLESKLMKFGAQRDDLARQMLTALAGAEFGGRQIGDGRSEHLVERANHLLAEVHAAAA